jgi:hypothetical protein
VPEAYLNLGPKLELQHCSTVPGHKVTQTWVQVSTMPLKSHINWWPTPVILTIQEAEIRRIKAETQTYLEKNPKKTH